MTESLTTTRMRSACDQTTELWGSALESFARIMLHAESMHDRFMAILNAEPGDTPAASDAAVYEHAGRMMSLSNEVYLLLIHGFGHGATTIARTSYQVAMIAMFIEKHGPEAAEAFHAHQPVHVVKMMTKAAAYDEPTARVESPKLFAAYDQQREALGTNFRDDYAWARTWTHPDAGPKTRFGSFAALAEPCGAEQRTEHGRGRSGRNR